jgi:hypothetical protein
VFAPVDKAYKALEDALSGLSKAQRQAHSRTKEAEVAAIAIDEGDAPKPGKVVTDKDKAKLRATFEKSLKAAEKDGACNAGFFLCVLCVFCVCVCVFVCFVSLRLCLRLCLRLRLCSCLCLCFVVFFLPLVLFCLFTFFVCLFWIWQTRLFGTRC